MMKNYTFRIAFILLFLGISNSYSQVVDRVDPPYWWTGMKNHELQLMIHGDKVSEYDIQLDKNNYLVSIDKTDNPNYIFLNLNIPDSSGSKTLNIIFSKKGKIAETVGYELKERIKNQHQHQGFDGSDIIYLIMPDRFSNGDPTNDSADDMLEKGNRKLPDGRHGGDIQGLINHLDYFKDLGVTTLWMTPMTENNMKAYSYHGYAVTDHYKIDPRFGTNKLYSEFINKCHQNDLKVILDVVLNHIGSNHWWMNDLPSKDWINYPNKFTRTNYRALTISDPHASKLDRDLMLSGWFDTSMPDLNQNNPFLATYLIQNTIWWIESTGLDGIRLDTQPYSVNSMVSKWAKSILDEYPDFNIVGEAWLNKVPLVAYWQKNTRNADNYNSNMPAVFDFPMYNALNNAFNEEQTWTDGIARLYYVLAQDFIYNDPDNLVLFADNHDVSRVFTTYGKDVNKLKLAMAFILTTRGIPSIYFGTEILMEGSSQDGHGNMRKDFPGGWPDDVQNCFTKEGRSKDQNDMFDYMQNIIQWRDSTKVVQTGELTHFIPENNVYVYFRHNNSQCVMVILNNNETGQILQTGKFNEFLKDYTSGYDIISKSKIKNLNMIQVNQKSAMIIELKK